MQIISAQFSIFLYINYKYIFRSRLSPNNKPSRTNWKTFQMSVIIFFNFHTFHQINSPLNWWINFISVHRLSLSWHSSALPPPPNSPPPATPSPHDLSPDPPLASCCHSRGSAPNTPTQRISAVKVARLGRYAPDVRVWVKNTKGPTARIEKNKNKKLCSKKKKKKKKKNLKKLKNCVLSVIGREDVN